MQLPDIYLGSVARSYIPYRVGKQSGDLPDPGPAIPWTLDLNPLLQTPVRLRNRRDRIYGRAEELSGLGSEDDALHIMVS